MEDNFLWKTTIDGRLPFLEDNILWKTNVCMETGVSSIKLEKDFGFDLSR